MAISLGKIFKRNKGNFKSLLRKLSVKIVRIIKNHSAANASPVRSPAPVHAIFTQIKPIVPIMTRVQNLQPKRPNFVPPQRVNPQHPNWNNGNHYTLVD